MPQNLVQKFSYETDTLDDLERVVNALAETMFRYPESEYTKLHVSFVQPYGYDYMFGFDRKKNPENIFLARLGDYRSDFKEGDIDVARVNMMTPIAVHSIRQNIEQSRLRWKALDYREDFDGSIACGYNVTVSNTTWKSIIISHCPILYGK